MNSTKEMSDELMKERRKADDEDHSILSALQFSVGKICHEQQSNSSSASSDSKKTKMSPEAISVLTELTYQYVTRSLANDLVAFSLHANRKTVNVDDVKLVARKDPHRLLPELERFCVEKKLVSASNNSKKALGGIAHKKGRATKDVSSVLGKHLKEQKSSTLFGKTDNNKNLQTLLPNDANLFKKNDEKMLELKDDNQGRRFFTDGSESGESSGDGLHDDSAERNQFILDDSDDGEESSSDTNTSYADKYNSNLGVKRPEALSEKETEMRSPKKQNHGTSLSSESDNELNFGKGSYKRKKKFSIEYDENSSDVMEDEENEFIESKKHSIIAIDLSDD